MNEYNTFIFDVSANTCCWVEGEENAIVGFDDNNDNTRTYYVECVDGFNIRVKLIDGEVYAVEGFGIIEYEPERIFYVRSWKRIV